MKVRKCASCEHEIYDDATDVCPFCGTRLPRGILAGSSGDSARKVRLVLVAAGLVLTLAVGLFVFMFTERAEEGRQTSSARVQHSVAKPAGDRATCLSHMTQVLNLQEEYLAANGRYADTAKELCGSPARLELRCPITDKVYDMDVQEDCVRVTCPTHGGGSR